MKMESSLRTALQNKQFTIYYQPLVDSRHHIVGMEALLRWYHPELGLISPSKFIMLAEETGAIIPIGKWVLSTACQQAKTWYDQGHTELYVAVNLSTRQFKEPDLVEIIEEVLEETGLPPQCLQLEVTESGIMDNPDHAKTKMQMLRTKGVRFSIDDFGTGYSSLSYLKRFPIDTLKIDQSFVVDSLTNTDDQEIIKTIIIMARSLHMGTVAEGIETREQHELLSQYGCHMMQGYYFGRPMPPEKFETLLQEMPPS
jgi:EAL domain-containing protein (putative c-di-GMP-specific phosphodiesterase class I)